MSPSIYNYGRSSFALVLPSGSGLDNENSSFWSNKGGAFHPLGGKAEANETPLQALLRELDEEAAIKETDILDVQYLGTYIAYYPDVWYETMWQVTLTPSATERTKRLACCQTRSTVHQVLFTEEEIPHVEQSLKTGAATHLLEVLEQARALEVVIDGV